MSSVCGRCGRDRSPVPATGEVRRVLSQVVDAACNSMARMLITRMRADVIPEITVDGQPLRVGGHSEANHYYRVGYIAGRNDTLRGYVKLLEDRLERQGLCESVASDCAAIVEVANG